MKKLVFLVAIVSLIVFACKKEPKIESSNFSITNEEIVKRTTSAVITVTYSYPSVLERVDGYISANNDMSNANIVRATINQSIFTLRFDDLQANTQYYYQYEYSTGIDTYITDISSFTTNDYATPIVTTADVTNITATSAHCGGEVTDGGGLEITARGVCWGTQHNPTTSNQHTSDGNGLGTFASAITGLTQNEKYYVRAYATNSKGTSYGEQKEMTTIEGLPSVTTNSITNVTATSAVCGGNVTSDSGYNVTVRGVCWSTNQNPTIDNPHTSNGNGTGTFTSNITGLSNNTKYYVRAYATNSNGISYGEQKSFQTLCEPPVGCINGLFSVSATQQVFFSKGNLQYKASTNTWRFAENQWCFVGGTEDGNSYGNVYENGVICDNTLISSTYDGWIDLFGWATSGYDHGASCYQPWSTDDRYWLYEAYGYWYYNLHDQTGKADWGYNSISNGGNAVDIWRTLKIDEWKYLFDTRNTSSGIRYVKAQVNEVNGVVLLPDSWNSNNYNLNDVNSGAASYMSNIINQSNWINIFEASGAVFLPAAGYRIITDCYVKNEYGHYWSANYKSGGREYVCLVSYNKSRLNPDSYCLRDDGCSVRLVQDY